MIDSYEDEPLRALLKPPTAALSAVCKSTHSYRLSGLGLICVAGVSWSIRYENPN